MTAVCSRCHACPAHGNCASCRRRHRRRLAHQFALPQPNAGGRFAASQFARPLFLCTLRGLRRHKRVERRASGSRALTEHSLQPTHPAPGVTKDASGCQARDVQRWGARLPAAAGPMPTRRCCCWAAARCVAALALASQPRSLVLRAGKAAAQEQAGWPGHPGRRCGPAGAPRCCRAAACSRVGCSQPNNAGRSL